MVEMEAAFDAAEHLVMPQGGERIFLQRNQNGLIEPAVSPLTLVEFQKKGAMSDDKTNRGAQDRSRISRGQEHNVRYWTQALGVSKEQLGAAVAAVGTSADRVKEHLRQDKK
jgi:hypothetical protein